MTADTRAAGHARVLTRVATGRAGWAGTAALGRGRTTRASEDPLSTRPGRPAASPTRPGGTDRPPSEVSPGLAPPWADGRRPAMVVGRIHRARRRPRPGPRVRRPAASHPGGGTGGAMGGSSRESRRPAIGLAGPPGTIRDPAIPRHRRGSRSPAPRRRAPASRRGSPRVPRRRAASRQGSERAPADARRTPDRPPRIVRGRSCLPASAVAFTVVRRAPLAAVRSIAPDQRRCHGSGIGLLQRRAGTMRRQVMVRVRQAVPCGRCLHGEGRRSRPGPRRVDPRYSSSGRHWGSEQGRKPITGPASSQGGHCRLTWLRPAGRADHREGRSPGHRRDRAFPPATGRSSARDRRRRSGRPPARPPRHRVR
jgi:hypothetical protein